MSSGRNSHQKSQHDASRAGSTAAEPPRIEWSRATILGFIEDYRRQRVLWDPNTKGYHIKQTKYEALKSLGHKYGAEIRAIRSKIKSLRSSFHREHGKVISGRRRGVHYQPMWFAYEAIRFILDGEQQPHQQRLPSAKATAGGRREAGALTLTKLERQRKVAQQLEELERQVAAAPPEGVADGATAAGAAAAEGAKLANEALMASNADQPSLERRASSSEEKLARVTVDDDAAATAAAVAAANTLFAARRQCAAAVRAASAAGSSSMVADLAAVCSGLFAGATGRNTMTEALLLTLEQELKVEEASASPSHSSATSICATSPPSSLSASPTSQLQAKLPPMTAATLATAASNTNVAAAVYAAALPLALADSNNNNTQQQCGNGSGSIVARMAAAVAAAAAATTAAAAVAGVSTNTTTTTTAATTGGSSSNNNSHMLLATGSVDELAAVAAAAAAATAGSAPSRHDFDNDSQNYCNIRAEDVKTELIESDSAELALIERHATPPVTSIPPYMYYKLQEPPITMSHLASSRKRKSHAAMLSALDDDDDDDDDDDAPAPSKQQQQHSNLNCNSTSNNNNNRPHDLSSSSSTSILMSNGAPNGAAATTPTSGKAPTTTATDEYGVFGEYVAITIRKLKTSKSKIVVKHLINNLLYEAELGKYDHGIPATKEPPQLYKL